MKSAHDLASSSPAFGPAPSQLFQLQPAETWPTEGVSAAGTGTATATDTGTGTGTGTDTSSRTGPRPATVLPVLLPPATLRPLAFRTFTKRHGLTLNSAALAALAAFVGRHCGSGWREDGLAEKVLDEAARAWKDAGGPVIVDGASGPSGPDGPTGDLLARILRTLEGGMTGGRLVSGRQAGVNGALPNQPERQLHLPLNRRRPAQPPQPVPLLDDAAAAAESRRDAGADGDGLEGEEWSEPRQWIGVVDAFQQPRLVYNPTRKHFERSPSKASFFPAAEQRTELFRQRYHITHQRLLRNESFQPRPVTHVAPQRRDVLPAAAAAQGWSTARAGKITAIANLLGRRGSNHVLLGMIAHSPTGALALHDLTASVQLDLTHARPVPEDGAWFCAGMIVLVDGVYYDDDGAGAGAGSDNVLLGSAGGVGGTIAGRFVAFSLGHPPCERRSTSTGAPAALAHSNSASATDRQQAAAVAAAAPFGWTDFLGVGSERAMGARMRRLQSRLLQGRPVPASASAAATTTTTTTTTTTAAAAAATSTAGSFGGGKIVIAASVILDAPDVLAALRTMLSAYSPGDAGLSDKKRAITSGTGTGAGTTAPAVVPPLAIVLAGSFATQPALTSVPGSSAAAYKDGFDKLAAVLADYPAVLARSTLVFVPGEADAWASAAAASGAMGERVVVASNSGATGAGAGAGTSPPLPQSAIPLAFTNRIRRAVADACRAHGTSTPPRPDGPVWTSNPARMTVFGVAGEVVLFRDDLAARLRRNSIPFPPRPPPPPQPSSPGQHEIGASRRPDSDPDSDSSQASRRPGGPRPTGEPERQQQQEEDTTAAAAAAASSSSGQAQDDRRARRLVHSLLAQSHLSPFPLRTRPQHWAHAFSLSLYPLPAALLLADMDAPPFALRYCACAVVNPGPLLPLKGKAAWAELDVGLGDGMTGRLVTADF